MLQRSKGIEQQPSAVTHEIKLELEIARPYKNDSLMCTIHFIP